MNDMMELHRPSQNAASDGNTGSANQSPVLPLADYLRSARQFLTISFPKILIQAAQAFVNLPFRPQIPAKETTTLVEALDDGFPSHVSPNREAIASSLYVLELTWPIRYVNLHQESLHPSHAKTAAQKASLTARKAELGRGVLCRLLTTFLDGGTSHRARRWASRLAPYIHVPSVDT
ncbi:MAG: hypothetical protein Q9194_006727 [Teloschistes cf. exilis]